MLTSQSENVMQEVYFRIKDGEETSNTIAKQLSASPRTQKWVQFLCKVFHMSLKRVIANTEKVR